jgi:hypothetical protein
LGQAGGGDPRLDGVGRSGVDPFRVIKILIHPPHSFAAVTFRVPLRRNAMRLAALPLAFILFAATPAVAQIVINGSRQASASQRERGVPMQQRGVSGDLRQIDRDARRARRNGEITQREERAIHRQAALIGSLGNSYAANGLSDAELAVLESQAFALRDLAQAPVRPVVRRGR